MHVVLKKKIGGGSQLGLNMEEARTGEGLPVILASSGGHRCFHYGRKTSKKVTLSDCAISTTEHAHTYCKCHT